MNQFPYSIAGKFKYFSGGSLAGKKIRKDLPGFYESNIMSAIFGERLTFSQEKGQEVKLVVYGDEFYAQYETEEGYSVIYDSDLGLFCYAFLKDGAFFSSKIPINKSPPQDLEKHLQEAGDVRLAKADLRAKRKPGSVSS